MNRLKKISLRLILSLFFLNTAIFAAGYEIDYAGSSLGFIAPSRLGDVEGKFSKWRFEGTIEDSFKVQGRIIVEVSSIDTNNRRRDDHLRSPDFFETEKFPNAVFTIASATPAGDEMVLQGSLMIRGVIKPVRISLRKAEELLYRGGVVVNRQDFGMSYQSALNPIEDQIPLRIQIKLKKK